MLFIAVMVYRSINARNPAVRVCARNVSGAWKSSTRGAASTEGARGGFQGSFSLPDRWCISITSNGPAKKAFGNVCGRKKRSCGTMGTLSDPDYLLDGAGSCSWSFVSKFSPTIWTHTSWVRKTSKCLNRKLKSMGFEIRKCPVKKWKQMSRNTSQCLKSIFFFFFYKIKPLNEHPPRQVITFFFLARGCCYIARGGNIYSTTSQTVFSELFHGFPCNQTLRWGLSGPFVLYSLMSAAHGR